VRLFGKALSLTEPTLKVIVVERFRNV